MLIPEELRRRARRAAEDAESYASAASTAARAAGALDGSLSAVTELHIADVWDSRAATTSRDRLDSLVGLIRTRLEVIEERASTWRRTADDLDGDAACLRKQATALEEDALRSDTCDAELPDPSLDLPSWTAVERARGAS